MASILNRTGARSGDIQNKVLYNLSVDKIVGFLNLDEKRTAKFLEVVSRPLLSADDIIFRQDAISDFYNCDGLISGLAGYFGKLSQLKKEYEFSKKEKMKYSVDPAVSDDVSLNTGLLQLDSFALKRLLIFVKTVYGFLCGFDLKSEALLNLKQSLGIISDSREYRTIMNICSEFENIGSHSAVNFLLNVNTCGEITASRLISQDSVKITENTVKKKKRFFSKETEEEYPSSEYVRANTTSYRKTFSKPFSELCELISGYIAQILRMYADISSELQFYEVAAAYCRVLDTLGCGKVFPVFNENGRTEIKGLRDLFLLLKNKGGCDVVPNDFEMTPQTNGTVIFGDNNSGKTVYLRSVGVCSLFAQSGLPVTADYAALPCYRSFFSMFSDSGNSNSVKGMGRFEKEVSELSEIIGDISENSLILFNEFFQSTDYNEGAEALAVILNHISGLRGKWICVTHMREIKNYLNDGTDYLMASENFRMIKTDD